MPKFRPFLILAGLALVATHVWAQSPGAPQGPARGVAPVQTLPGNAFHATNYEVRASLDTVGQVMNAQAKVDFAASEAARVVDVELNQNLRVNSVRDVSGKPVSYDRDDSSGLKLHVTLADTVPVGGKVTLFFDYGGPLSSRLNDPNQPVRMAYVARDGGYLLLPSRWFPLTDFPANRYTGIFQIEVPGTMTVVGTGTPVGAPQSVTPKISAPASAAPPTAVALGNARRGAPVSPTSAPAPPSMENERMLYTYRVDKPEDAGTFVFAPLQLSPQRAQGAAYSIYTPAATANTAPAYADAISHVLVFFNDDFGALPDPGLTVAQLPDGTVDGFAAPGLVLVSARNWTPKPNERLLADLVAHQWWGAQVTPATSSDVWVTDGLSRYSEGLYVEQSDGKEGMNKALEDFAVGALMFDDSAPIADAGRLEAGSDEYQSVVVNKGAMVFHMLRSIIGDANFSALLKDFYSHYAGKSARVEDFEKLAEARLSQPAPAEFKMGNTPAASAEPTSLRPFFTQWLDSTGVPEFNLEYVVYRTKKGFRIVGKAKQNLDVFHMDVEIEVQTEGNPEYKTITLSGKESTFTVETFGRPKPNGIVIDPHDYILKSSQKLRVRGIIARGESLAALGRYYDAVQQYQKALEQDRLNALADFRMGEAFFYQRNYAASAQSFRDALDGATDLTTKWTEVWSHIYLGRIYDIQGDRTRAVNEYSKAKQTADDTGGAQAEAEKSLKKAYSETGA
ncbi:MAG TPA: M1 family aminopeptidase [Candidatus Acidoferrales bacterium]|nr:M1 family aminopeptidase [Candidatus Acidoferrales bacterium]